MDVFSVKKAAGLGTETVCAPKPASFYIRVIAPQ